MELDELEAGPASPMKISSPNLPKKEAESPVKLQSSQGMVVQHRVKAFILNPDNNDWDEMATGMCTPDPSEDDAVYAIRIRAEEDYSSVLFTAIFHKDQEIGVQNDTVLTWTTIDGDEAALSFENSSGCEEFWHSLCLFQGRSSNEFPSSKASTEPIEYDDEDEDDDDENDENGAAFDTIDADAFGSSDPSAACLIGSSSMDFFEGAAVSSFGSNVEISFPEKPDIFNLSEIEESLIQALNLPILRRRVASLLLDYQYIPCLLHLFLLCEENEKSVELSQLYRIFKTIFSLNNQEILKELLNEENYLTVAGVFEYDPSANGHHVGEYRAFLVNGGGKFCSVLPIENEDVLALIHQTYRLQYFKDVILARMLDEESSASLMLIIRLNHMAIINALDSDPRILEVMQSLLQSRLMALNDQLQLLRFFKEFLTISKTVTLRKGLQIYQPTVLADFLRFIAHTLKAEAAVNESNAEGLEELKLLSVELLINFIQHDSAQVRAFLCSNSHEASCSLMATIIDLFTSPQTSSSIRWQVVTALRLLLDTFNPNPTVNSFPGFSTMANAPNPQLLNQAIVQKSTEDFLNYFYPEFACRLLRPLIDFDKVAFTLSSEKTDVSVNHGHPNDHKGCYFFSSSLPSPNAEILFHLGELLCSFIAQHRYRIKYLVLRNLILQNCLLLLKCREKHLQLVGLRVFRATLGIEDEFYFRFFIQHRSFSSLFSLYRALGGGERCDNLVTSAILEIFETIRIPRESFKTLVRHLSAFYRTELDTFLPPSVFKGILETEDRINRESSVVSFLPNSDSESTSSGIKAGPGLGQNDNVTRPFHDPEEDYFSQIEGEDEDEDDHFDSEHDSHDGPHDDLPDEAFMVSKGPQNSDEEESSLDNLIAKSGKVSPASPTKKSKI